MSDPVQAILHAVATTLGPAFVLPVGFLLFFALVGTVVFGPFVAAYLIWFLVSELKLRANPEVMADRARRKALRKRYRAMTYPELQAERQRLVSATTNHDEAGRGLAHLAIGRQHVHHDPTPAVFRHWAALRRLQGLDLEPFEIHYLDDLLDRRRPRR